MKKLIFTFFLLIPSFSYADRLGSLRSGADVLLTTQSAAGYSVFPSTGSTTNGALTFPNGFYSAGFNWTTRTPPSTNQWRSVVFGGGIFVAVGANATTGAVGTSPDGITWTSRTVPNTNKWQSVTYGNGLFVAVSNTGTGNRVMTSLDGITWEPQISAADNNWTSVTYGEGIFVAVANSGTGDRVMTSYDGISWVTRTSANNNNWLCVTYGDGIFVAGAQHVSGDRIMTSPDGVTWTGRTSANSNIQRAVAYGNGKFVMVSSGGTGDNVQYSTDGITWTAGTSAANNTWVGITYGQGLYAAVSSDGTNRVMVSSNAANWYSFNSATQNTWLGVGYGNGVFVGVGGTQNSNDMMTSGFPIQHNIPYDHNFQGSVIVGSTLSVQLNHPESFDEFDILRWGDWGTKLKYNTDLGFGVTRLDRGGTTDMLRALIYADGTSYMDTIVGDNDDGILKLSSEKILSAFTYFTGPSFFRHSVTISSGMTANWIDSSSITVTGQSNLRGVVTSTNGFNGGWFQGSSATITGPTDFRGTVTSTNGFVGGWFQGSSGTYTSSITVNGRVFLQDSATPSIPTISFSGGMGITGQGNQLYFYPGSSETQFSFDGSDAGGFILDGSSQAYYTDHIAFGGRLEDIDTGVYGDSTFDHVNIGANGVAVASFTPTSLDLFPSTNWGNTDIDVLKWGQDPDGFASNLPLRMKWSNNDTGNGWLQFDDGADNPLTLRANLYTDSLVAPSIFGNPSTTLYSNTYVNAGISVSSITIQPNSTTAVPMIFRRLTNFATNYAQVTTTGNTPIWRLTRGGGVFIGTGSGTGYSGATDNVPYLDISQSRSPAAIVIGGDDNNNTRTNATTKVGFITMVPYLSTHALIGLFGMGAGPTNSDMSFGGGSSSFYAATSISFYTAADNQTQTGNIVGRVDGSGNWGLGRTFPNARVHIEQAGGNGQLRSGYDGSNYWNALTGNTGVTTFSGVGTSPSFVISAISTFTATVSLSTTTMTGGFTSFSKTIANLDAMTYASAGIQYYCSDCTQETICVSTGTAAGSIASPSDRGNHCN